MHFIAAHCYRDQFVLFVYLAVTKYCNLEIISSETRGPPVTGASNDQRWLDDILCQHQPPLIWCQMSPRDQDHVRTSPQIPQSQSPINETMSDHHLPRQRFADKSLSALFVLWLLVNASQFLFGCKFKCLTLAGIIVACQGRASDPSLTWSPVTPGTGQGTPGLWEPGELETQTAVFTARCLVPPTTSSERSVLFYVKAKAFPSYFRKLQRM